MPLHSLPPPPKKRRLDRRPDAAADIKRIETDITNALANNASLNALADLTDILTTSHDPHDTSKAIYALYRVFVAIIAAGHLKSSQDEAFQRVKTWLLEQLNLYVAFLGGLLQDDEKFLRKSALDILFSLLKHLSTAATTASPAHPQIHASHFRKIVHFLLLGPPSQRTNDGDPQSTLVPDALAHFYDTWLSVYDDIRWFFFRDSFTLLRDDKTHPVAVENLVSILERLTTFPTDPEELDAWWIVEFTATPSKNPSKTSQTDASAADTQADQADDDWRKFFEDEPAPADSTSKSTTRLHKMTLHQSLHSLASHRAVFTRTWLSLLSKVAKIDPVEKREALTIRILNVLHHGVLPLLSRPLLVMDWVSACVDLGGAVGLLGLNALFLLIKDYNLDYPSFYSRLYAFLDRDLLHLKHRPRFFRLTELFLSSTHLPANHLASFVKRLSRLSLFAPPSAIITIIPFTYNILKRHPALMEMIHRVDDGSNASVEDPFLPEETDPTKTRAIESSLWELVSHTQHYHAPVSTMAKIFSEAFTKPKYSMEDFLDHTYATLFETEAGRRIKKEPPLNDTLTGRVVLFPLETQEAVQEGQDRADSDSEDLAAFSTSRDPVIELWSFA